MEELLIDRRDILKFFGLIGVTFVIPELILLPSTSEANPILQVGLRKLLQELAFRALPIAVAETVINKLEHARTKRAPYSQEFHHQFALDVELSTNVNPTKTKYCSYFEINKVPRMDLNKNIPPIKDLNRREMYAILNEPSFTRHNKIPYPCDKRSEPTIADNDKFKHLAKSKGCRPSLCQLDYTRPFNFCDNQYKGYGFSKKSNPMAAAFILEKEPSAAVG